MVVYLLRKNASILYSVVINVLGETSKAKNELTDIKERNSTISSILRRFQMNQKTEIIIKKNIKSLENSQLYYCFTYKNMQLIN